jgi:tRNA(fMet)-specific endonuclease VapC
MSGYMLDTKVASHAIRGDRPEITSRLASLPIGEIAVSAITEAELLYGLAKRNHPPRLAERVRQFLLRADVIAWDSAAARTYGDLRARCEAIGTSLSPLDMLIAAHAIAADAVLVTRDKAFARVPAPLSVEDWD